MGDRVKFASHHFSESKNEGKSGHNFMQLPEGEGLRLLIALMVIRV